MQRKNTWFIAFVMVLLLALIPYDNVYAAKVKVKSVKVQAPYAKTIEVAKKKSVKIVPVVTVTPDKKANKKVSFKSKNKKIATVNSKGVVKGKKPGKTKIVVTSKKNSKKKATITVVVKKNPIQKVALDKTNVTLEPNTATLLKATITAKSGSSKKIYWTSSNSSVATVSQSGSVVAKKEGTATITAKAIDGSKKCATCVVTVKAKDVVKPVKPTVVNLKSIAVNNYQMVTFTLDNACKLTANQIVLQAKANKEDKYEKKMSITSLTTTDNKTYRIEILGKDCLPNDGYVLLSIPTLSGSKKQMEVPVGDFTPASTYRYSSRSYTVGTSISYSIDKMIEGGTYSVEGLLPGLKVENLSGDLYLIGTPTQTGATVVKIHIKKNNRLVKIIEIPLMIYDSTHMVAAPVDIYLAVASGNWGYVDKYIAVSGGKAPYTYSIVGEDYGLEMDGSYLDGELTAPGEYSLVLEVKDSSTPSLSCRVNVNIHYEELVRYLINVNDANGNPLYDGVEISLVNQDNDGRAAAYTMDVEYGSATGNIVTGTYDIYVYSEYEASGYKTYKVYDDVVLNESKFFGTIKIPLYRVDMSACNGQADLYNVDWYDNNSKKVGNGSMLYLENGTYDLHTSYKKDRVLTSMKQLTAKFTVNSQPLFVKTTMSNLADAPGVLNMGVGVTPVSLSKGAYTLYEFVPDETCYYKFTTDSTNTIYLYMTDEYFTSQTGYSIHSTNSVKMKLTKGKKYYIKAMYGSASNEGDFNITLEKN